MQVTSPSVRSLVLMPVLAALVVVLGMVPAVPVPGLAVPITLQTLGVMLAANLAGPWVAAGAMSLFWLAAAVGLPVLSGGRGGLGALLGPSGGYVLGWIVGAIVMGLVARALHRLPDAVRLGVADVLGGVLVVHLCGIAWMVLVNPGTAPGAALAADLWFVPGDLLKCGAAVAVAVAVLRGYPPARELARAS